MMSLQTFPIISFKYLLALFFLWLLFNLNLNLQGVQQSNSYDCGIFVIHFSRMFLKDPEFYSKLIKVTFYFCKKNRNIGSYNSDPPHFKFKCSLACWGCARYSSAAQEHCVRVGERLPEALESDARTKVVTTCLQRLPCHVLYAPHGSLTSDFVALHLFLFLFLFFMVSHLIIDLTISGSFFFYRAEIQKVWHHAFKTQTKLQTHRGYWAPL